LQVKCLPKLVAAITNHSFFHRMNLILYYKGRMKMKKIPLAEGVKLKGVLTKKISELTNEIQSVSKAIVEKGQTPKPSGRSLSEVEAELAQVRKDSRTLDRLIYRANIDNTVNFKGEELPIVEAIELATQ